MSLQAVDIERNRRRVYGTSNAGTSGRRL